MKFLRIHAPTESFDRLTSEEVAVLATYNAERSRGLVHDPEWQQSMAEMQTLFDQQQIRRLEADGFREIGDGVWARP